MEVLGIDIGGTGIKGAIVDLKTSKFTSERIRYSTPKNATPESILDVVNKIIKDLDYQGFVGCGFPAAIKDGVVMTASNIDKSWIGININNYFSTNTKLTFQVINDVDATGLAEMTYGSAKGISGTVIVTAFGTGIGTALFKDGILYPNTELGHIMIKKKKTAEQYVSNAIRVKKEMSYDKFAKRVSQSLKKLNFFFYPELIVFAGGISKKWDKFGNKIKVNTKVVPAKLKNHAGIIGAASVFRHNHFQKQ